MASQKRDANELFATAVATLPKDKPIIFTNLIRFRPQADYSKPPPPGLESSPSPCTGEEAYFKRYFPLYHAAARSVYGEDATKVQRVLYTGQDLSPLKFSAQGASLREDYWHAVVMTRVENWEVVQKISGSPIYTEQASCHRLAAVEDDELFVSTSSGAET